MTPCVSSDREQVLPVGWPCPRVRAALRATRSDAVVSGTGRRLRPECAAGPDQIAGRALAMAGHPSWDGDIASFILVA
jgi:hypothetical protein